MTTSATPELGAIKALASLTEDELRRFENYIERAVYPAETAVVRQGESGRELYMVLDGEARLRRADLDLGGMTRGDHFGELGLLAGNQRAASVIAASRLVVAELSRPHFEAMCREDPVLAIHLTTALAATLGRQLTQMTDSVGLLFRERSLPRRLTVDVRIAGKSRPVRTGTALRSLLPAEVGGAKVVAALFDHKAVSLATPLAADGSLEPLTTAHWEGERIHRRSVALLLIEAAQDIAPGMTFRMAASVGSAQWVEAAPTEGVDMTALAARLTARMRELVAHDVAFRQEWWTTEEAVTHFREQGWNHAAKLLATVRAATVPLVSCGRVYALSMGPLVPSSGLCGDFALYPDTASASGLVLVIGVGKKRPDPSRGARYAEVMGQHERWLASLEVRSVGDFNGSCVDGHVAATIRVAEGFHEKRFGQIADAITARAGKVNVVCVAGPSSSGKTTFLRRLSVQLQVNGQNPLGISLDDYYVDRETTPRDESGELDFEALDALDLPLLQVHLRRLLAGETVKTARYDFLAGKSHPDGGPEITLGPHDLLLLEGIHGLNPALLDEACPRDRLYKLYIQPMSSLAFDRLSRFNPSDLRLIRRIVRDRHSRGYKATENIQRWASVRAGERKHIFPFIDQADAIFDTSLIYEPSVLKVYAERYLLEVPPESPAFTTANRLRDLIDRFVAIYPEHVPPTSILREFIGGSGFDGA